MNKWIAEFELEDGDTMPEHMDLEYKGVKIDFHCRPKEQETILDKIRAEIIQLIQNGTLKIESGNEELFNILDKYKTESEDKEC